MTRRTSGNGEPWTAEHDKAINDLYPDGGWQACVEHMPDRSGAAIQLRAKRLGIRRTKRPPKFYRDSKPETDNPVVYSQRICLRCREEFQSSGIHNRVCSGCKSSEAWQSGALFAGISV